MRFLLVALLLVGGVSVPVHAQPSSDDPFAIPSEPPEWGDVSPELLRPTSYPADSNATAVVLSDVGEVRFRFNGEVELERHRRVKILGESGYDEGTVVIPYYVKDGAQRISDVEGVTYTLADDGSIVEHELDDDDVYVEETSEDWEQVRFTLPNLTPGAVIEFSYERISETFFRLPTWSFQSSEPTLYSAYEATIPKALSFVTLTRGTQDYTKVEKETVPMVRFEGQAQETRWVMTDVPALREEPFMTTPENYRSQIQLQVSALRNPRTGQVEERFMNSWPKTAESLLDRNDFGDDLGEDDDVAETVEDLTNGLSSDSAKVQAIHEFVRTSISWDGRSGWTLTDDTDDVLSTKTGTAGDVNLLLTSMLQHAGIDAHPALTSTRSHGALTTLYPILEQFNYVLAAIPTGDEGDGEASYRLLDATDPHVPASMLPKRALNGQAWVVRESPSWVPVTPPSSHRRSSYAHLSLADDGALTGTITVTDHGYASVERRGQLSSAGDDASFAKNHVLDDLKETSIDSIRIKHRDDPRQPLRTKATLSLPAHAQKAGSMLYLEPVLLPRFATNPFQQEKRKFPINFAYPLETTYIARLDLPDGYKVVDTPKSQRINLPKEAGSYVLMVQARGSTVSVRSVLSITEPVLPKEYYPLLRDFIDRVVASQAESLVLEATETTDDASSSSE